MQACPNTKCRRVSLSVDLTAVTTRGLNRVASEILDTWQLMPDSLAKEQPDYIPAAIVQDYKEACRILNLSPKASATLARRCLQGMIRDFHGISKRKLFDAISELNDVVPAAEWTALDSLRSIGNIGAHMQSDVNLIIDIDAGEAKKLITFIEYLMKQWYVKRHDDEENLRELQSMALSKKTEQSNGNGSTEAS